MSSPVACICSVALASRRCLQQHPSIALEHRLRPFAGAAAPSSLSLLAGIMELMRNNSKLHSQQSKPKAASLVSVSSSAPPSLSVLHSASPHFSITDRQALRPVSTPRLRNVSISLSVPSPALPTPQQRSGCWVCNIRMHNLSAMPVPYAARTARSDDHGNSCCGGSPVSDLKLHEAE